MNEDGTSHRAKVNSVIVEWSEHFRIGRYGGSCIGLSY